ncbi:unnamed protein product [Echinostoma caproni]|uniref:L-aminoadipate-semialdehyde dehydrogenase-phosphopantetheinyl transferase n=1 Tax=Echinostoma caproni TaxID=27848 RepID=A0A183AX59_9TREM|nr:unnamed protein product [Echinostoma caproni]
MRENQADCKPGPGCIDHIFAKLWSSDILFVDPPILSLKTAFDSVERYKLRRCLSLKDSQKSVTTFVHTLRRVFAPNELDSILSPVDDKKRMYHFYRHWCLKEAYLKALGCGIRLPLSSIAFLLPKSTDEPPRCLTLASSSQNWYFEEHILSDSHVAAVAWCSEDALTAPEKQPFEETVLSSLLKDLIPSTAVSECQWTAFTEKPRAPALQHQAVVLNVSD